MARAPLLLLLPLLAALCLASLAPGANAAGRKMVGVYELRKGDFSAKVTNWGATVTSVVFPDSKGNLGDVVLGYDTIAEYVIFLLLLTGTSECMSARYIESTVNDPDVDYYAIKYISSLHESRLRWPDNMNGSSYFGALVGRVANRVAKARFVLDGKVYHLYANDGKNALHGGHRGFSKVIWTVKEYVSGGDSPHITLYYHSFDGEQGFPGALDVYVTYELSSPYVLSVRMNATALDKATPVNLAQHTYWNLGGQGSGDVLGNTVQLFASQYTPVDATLIPTGQLAPVAGTPYDLRAPTAVAAVRDGASGRALELWADQPGVQFYTGNFLQDVKGKGGRVYGQYGALCLETQGFPDAVNHPDFPSQIVRPGQAAYKHDMVFKFSF
uniref:Aldose 1-epimerase n=1 Tax=Aegilops tauschii TaxID=37682 RepID=M8C5R3_AEGTA